MSQEPSLTSSYANYSHPVTSSYSVASASEPSRLPPPPSYPPYIPSHSSYTSRPHPPAPPVMPWRETPAVVPAPTSAPASYNSNYSYPTAPVAPYSGHSHYDSRMPPSAGYAPYSRPDNFGSFSNLRHQDWSSVNLIPFEKNFYREHPAVRVRSESEVRIYREKHAMSVFGSNIPKPVENFEEGCFPEYISKMLSSQGFAHPTPIQAQVIKNASIIKFINYLFLSLGMAYGNVWS